MKILLKCPTRSRPQKVIDTLRLYMKLANHPEQIGVAISCDTDDTSMSRNLVQDELLQVCKPAAWKRIFFSPNKTKIQACNANMNEIDWEWDIVVLVSDDMIPQIKGWDDVIRTHMLAKFPDTFGVLWFNDGFQGKTLNTLCIFGRKMYNVFGYIYSPDYKSLFCDTELTDRCNGDIVNRCVYIPYCIIRHEHPGTGFAQNMDSLYATNQKYWNEDLYTYISRKKYKYVWSVLIPTIPGREAQLHKLMESIREKIARLCRHLSVEFCIAFDNRETSVGAKREALLKQAKGRYVSFIDDDDEITDAYIEDLWECIRGEYSTMRLRGQMNQYTFTHSTEVRLTDFMATKTDPPVFQRPPNHLNPMLADVAKLISFKDATRGEDLDWTLRMLRSGFLTTEYRSDPSRIHYLYNLGDRTVEDGVVTHQQNVSYETMLKTVFTPNGHIAPPPPEPQPTKFNGLKLGTRGFVSK